ncbi:alpha/beta hydrolase [Mammaliicoccus sciuri]|uniref:alpha/beta hydrolase n=2 Tax=Mammaliicoccus sciuri TaxID=1296 RepID=UPI0007343852|nr:alpha/beta hydrolase [Mammaliicoccus sciuri]KTT83197.1 alpha/beta hydrolase [Mammaliicoccus sciuri]KTT86724.1 alpha/beta hydrolase [Mammaliicoccus sciuri]KTT92236.1 alpha/beta hydrolase [Mammaliicoccus sciuri]KTT94366.1 alpha/beta hydrolase [Mammaliicoccus sciuri]KTW13216.1 alpha/beta hydrolase [Mammaliicoccus sciuri]
MKEQNLKFKTRNIYTTGILRTPEQVDDKALPTIVVMHPISSVKEQTASIYARRLTEEGFATFAFDAGHQGELHEGPDYIENPYYRVEDAKYAIDFLNTLDIVDNKRIGILGICGGGGYAVNASLTDKRIKAVGSVVGADFGTLTREGDLSPNAALDMLHNLAIQREAEATGADVSYTQYIPDSEEQRQQANANDIDVKQAVDYYRTDRGYNENSINRYRLLSNIEIAGFDAYHLVDKLLDQPLYIVAGNVPGAFGSYRFAYQLFDNALTKDKKIHIIDGVSHYDLYDQPKAVDEALSGLIPFYKEKL